MGFRAGIGMWLESAEHALVAELGNGVEQGVQLAGVMSVIVENVGSVHSALELEAAARAGEAQQPFSHGGTGQTENVRHGGCRKGIGRVVFSGDVQGDIGVALASG